MDDRDRPPLQRLPEAALEAEPEELSPLMSWPIASMLGTMTRRPGNLLSAMKAASDDMSAYGLSRKAAAIAGSLAMASEMAPVPRDTPMSPMASAS